MGGVQKESGSTEYFALDFLGDPSLAEIFLFLKYQLYTSLKGAFQGAHTFEAESGILALISGCAILFVNKSY